MKHRYILDMMMMMKLGFGWVAIEPVHRTVLGVYLCLKTQKHAAGCRIISLFLRSLVKLYGKHILYSDGGPWYPDAYHTLGGLEHNRLHSEYEKSLIIERTIVEYFKDRTEYFDDYYYPCIKHGGCDIYIACL
jgi:putative transposase